jgi:hypothetical protein
MALAETTVVENGQRAGHRYCPSQRCCSNPASSQRGQQLSSCDDEKHATMGMSWCPDGTGVLQHEGPVRGPLAGPVRDFAKPYEPAGA